MRAWFSAMLAAMIAVVLALPNIGIAQSTAPASAAGKAFSQEQLDQMLAPVALYPDALLAQILMASTYPLEVVSAARWVKDNPKVTGKALEDAMHKQAWDPSVKSLAPFPSVLQMMDAKLEWTQQLGDAFLAQRDGVMTTVQGLRKKAYTQGNLKSSEQQKIVVEKEIIVIQPATTTVYVPVYNPTIVYGTWWYPAYVPYYYYPPGYVVRPGVGFTAGIIVGAALWGGVNWRDRDVNININHYNQFNRTNITRANWQHDPAHRKGVAYRDPTIAQKYNRDQAADAARRDAARKDMSPGPARDAGPAGRPAARDADRPGAGPRDRPGRDRDDDDGPDKGRSGRDRK